MKIEFLSSGSDSFPWSFFVLWLIVWLGVLLRVLTRADFDTMEKILWVLVVIFVPFFGVFLYFLAAPTRQNALSSAEGGLPSSEHRPAQIHSDVAGTPWANNTGYTNDK